MTDDARVTTAGAAELLGVSPGTVASYAARGIMPAPSSCDCCGYGPTWSRAELLAWMATRPGKGGRPRNGGSPMT